MSDRTYAGAAETASFEDLTGIRSKTPDEVRGAVNAAVYAASSLAADIGKQAETTASRAMDGAEGPSAETEQEPTLEGNVAAMDAPSYEAVPEPTLETQHNGREHAAEEKISQESPEFM